MVDCVMIDSAYDGLTFKVLLSDVPDKKTDFVEGHYELPATNGKTTVAVKVVRYAGRRSSGDPHSLTRLGVSPLS